MNIQGSLPSYNSFSTLHQEIQESSEESNFKSSSQIAVEGMSQQKKSSIFWLEEEREVLRKVISDYKIEYSEDTPIKWSCITPIFNQIMKEKDSSRPPRDSKRLSEQWSNYLNPFVIPGTIEKKHELPLLQLIYYFSIRNNKGNISWIELSDFIKDHNKGYYYSANSLKNLHRRIGRGRSEDVLKKDEEISEDEAVRIAKSLQLHLESVGNEEKYKSIAVSVESRPLKKRALEDRDVSNHRMMCPSQIEAEDVSQQERSSNFWTEEEREVLRNVMSAYKTTCSEGTPIKWSCITSIFNRIMKEKDSSRPQRESKSLLGEWQNGESQRTIQKRHELPLLQLISCFSSRNDRKTINWVALSDFIKEHNGGYYYSANALKNLHRRIGRGRSEDVLKKGEEISADEAVRIAESLQLQRESTDNEEKCGSIAGSLESNKAVILEGVNSSNDSLDAFVFDPDLWSR